MWAPLFLDTNFCFLVAVNSTQPTAGPPSLPASLITSSGWIPRKRIMGSKGRTGSKTLQPWCPAVVLLLGSPASSPARVEASATGKPPAWPLSAWPPAPESAPALHPTSQDPPYPSRGGLRLSARQSLPRKDNRLSPPAQDSISSKRLPRKAATLEPRGLMRKILWPLLKGLIVWGHCCKTADPRAARSSESVLGSAGPGLCAAPWLAAPVTGRHRCKREDQGCVGCLWRDSEPVIQREEGGSLPSDFLLASCTGASLGLNLPSVLCGL